jgi:hypothetical protein
MANKRVIKKDIDFLVGEVISDCYTYMYLNGDKNKEKVLGIIENVVDKRNDLIDLVNRPARKPAGKMLRKLKATTPDAYRAAVKTYSKDVKVHFRGVYNDLLVLVDDSFSKLSEIVK